MDDIELDEESVAEMMLDENALAAAPRLIKFEYLAQMRNYRTNCRLLFSRFDLWYVGLERR
jgi:hypothetical protein